MNRLSLFVLCLSSLVVMARSLPRAQTPSAADVVRFDPALDAILSADTKLEMLPAEGFQGGEGPAWVPKGKPGYLLFSDVPGNRIYKWTPDCVKSPCPPSGKLTVFLEHSGYKDASQVGARDSSGAPLHGTNGLTLDQQHRLVIDATGDRAVERIEKNGERTILADRYEGKRLSCPNDIVAKSDGAIYFTDGGAGCIGGESSPQKELPFHGVYFVKDGKLQLLDKDPGGAPPNGIAISPDGKTLYVTNAPMFKQIFAYDVQPDDTVKNRRLFIDLAGEKGLGGPDGVRRHEKCWACSEPQNQGTHSCPWIDSGQTNYGCRASIRQRRRNVRIRFHWRAFIRVSKLCERS